jgi:TRAP-type C4-dicarboxylate transport system substrate-binding protein
MLCKFRSWRWGLLALFCLCLQSQTIQAKTYKIATIAPDGLGWIKALRQTFKTIDEETEGRVKFKLYPGGVQGDDFTVVRKMRIGQLHGGALAAGTLIRFYTDLQIYNMPLQFDAFAEVDQVRKVMDQGIIDGISDGGMTVLPLIETGFAYLMSKKPISNPEDLTNLKVWVPEGDPLGEQLVKLFKVSPVPLNITDVLAALQTGLVDAVAVPPLVAIALQWHNHVTHVMDLPLMYIYSVFALDPKVLSGLDEADRLIVRKHLEPLMRRIDRENRSDNEKAFEALVSGGIRKVTPSESELGAWEIVADTAVEQMLAAGEITQPQLDAFQRALEAARK